jgi:HEAT repeat protein
MSITILNELYQNLKKAKNPYDVIFNLKEVLLSSDHHDFLEFHYSIIQDKSLPDNVRSNIKSFFFSEAANKRNKETVAEFLYNKYLQGIEDISLRADVIQLLGNLRSKFAKQVALENITIRKGDLRYRSIIVLGWVGDKNDLEILNERLINDPEPQLRGYAATAMRQIWFNHPKTKDAILKLLKIAIEHEEDEKALEGIIITTQELLKKKLGLKETKYGDVSGDMVVSKNKTAAALENY